MGKKSTGRPLNDGASQPKSTPSSPKPTPKP